MSEALKKTIFIIVLIAIGIGAGLAARHFFGSPEPTVPYYSQEEFAQKRAELEAEIANDPANIELHTELATILYNYYTYQEDALDAAIEEYSWLIQNQTGTGTLADLHFNLGNAQREAKDYTGAITTYKAGLEFDPENWNTRYNIAYTYLDNLDDPDSAEIWLDSIKGNMAQDPAFHYVYARIKFEQGDYPEAEKALDVVMILDPKNAPVVRGDLYRRVLEAQGKELPADAEVPDINVEAAPTEE